MIGRSHFWRGFPFLRKRRSAAQIFETYKNALYHTARRLVTNDADAEDAVMLAMERICRHLELLNTLSEPEVQAYLYKTVRSCAIDLYRAQKRQDDVLWRYVENDTLTEEMPEPDDFGDTEPYVAALPEKYRLPITLFYRDGYSIRKIAEMLHTPESTIGTRLARAREILKEKILADRATANTGEVDTKCEES